jgi:hypothetical protein
MELINRLTVTTLTDNLWFREFGSCRYYFIGWPPYKTGIAKIDCPVTVKAAVILLIESRLTKA